MTSKQIRKLSLDCRQSSCFFLLQISHLRRKSRRNFLFIMARRFSNPHTQRNSVARENSAKRSQTPKNTSNQDKRQKLLLYVATKAAIIVKKRLGTKNSTQNGPEGQFIEERATMCNAGSPL